MSIKNFLSEVIKEWRRFIKFSIVGGSGIFVNLAFIWIGNVIIFQSVTEKIKTPLSYALGIIISIFTNFVLNDIWTWGDVREKTGKGFISRLVKYYIVAGVAGVVQFAVSNGLVLVAAIYLLKNSSLIPVSYKMVFAMVGIAIGILINFFLNHYWTFKKR